MSSGAPAAILSSRLRAAGNDLAGALSELEELVALGTKELPPDSPRLLEYREALQKCQEALQQSRK